MFHVDGFIDFHFLFLANNDRSISCMDFPLVESNRCALSVAVPPHFKPIDCRVHFNASPPSDTNSLTVLNACRSIPYTK